MAKKILFVAVHPDDETLAFGGTILKHKNDGDEIYWLIITNVYEEHGWDTTFVKKRQKEIEKVKAIYNFDGVAKLDFPSTKLDSISDSNLISSISDVINDFKPDTIYLPFMNDVHSDHRISFNALFSCTKNFRYPFIKKILMGETLSETEFSPSVNGLTFVPNVYVDITKYMSKKNKIMSIYSSEVMDGNMPRSLSAISALANYRGSRIGVEFAEDFMLLFEKS